MILLKTCETAGCTAELPEHYFANHCAPHNKTPMKNFNIEDLNDGTVRVTGICGVTRKSHSVIVNKQGFERWRKENGLIQRYLPEASIDTREFLISGTSPEGWKILFGNDE